MGGDGSPSGSGLPSLVDARKNTAEEVCLVLVALFSSLQLSFCMFQATESLAETLK